MDDFARLYRRVPFCSCILQNGSAGGSDERCDGINLQQRDIPVQSAFPSLAHFAEIAGETRE